MNTIPLTSPNAFECVACDILDDYTQSFSEANGCATAPGPDGFIAFTAKGDMLYQRYIDRLRAIGEKLFPGCGPDLELKGWMVRDDIWGE